jgi:hypothetical protein
MLGRNNDAPCWVKAQLGDKWRWLEQITFAAFMGSLVTLLVLLYAEYR